MVEDGIHIQHDINFDAMIGMDLRDTTGFIGAPNGDGADIQMDVPVTTIALSRLVPLVPFIGARLATWARGFAQGTRVAWDSLPDWVRTAMGLVGLTGAAIVIDQVSDVPLIPGGGNGAPHMPLHLVDGHLGDHIVGGWNANGVTFYRLMSGKLAVQNKKGRWKVWMPKKPIVLMPGGAKNLKTLLRADAVLNKQSKSLQKMLNRRAPRPKRAPAQPKAIIVEQHSREA